MTNSICRALEQYSHTFYELICTESSKAIAFFFCNIYRFKFSTIPKASYPSLYLMTSCSSLTPRATCLLASLSSVFCHCLGICISQALILALLAILRLQLGQPSVLPTDTITSLPAIWQISTPFHLVFLLSGGAPLSTIVGRFGLPRQGSDCI